MTRVSKLNDIAIVIHSDAHSPDEMLEEVEEILKREDPKPKTEEKQIFKVRCARTFAAYFYVEATSQDEAEEIARREWEKAEAESEASHIHNKYEVEET